MTIDDIQQEQALATYDGEDKIVRGDILLDTLKNKALPKLFFKSKIPKLDKIIKDGFRGGQLIVVSGITGQGKSTLCKSIGLSAMEQGLLSTWFSYELDMQEFLEDFPHDTVANILLPATLKGRSPEWIELRAWEAKLKYESNLVFIDHLHFLVDLHKSRNISFDVGSVVRNLKLLAVKHNLVVFLICHTMKTKGDGEVELGLGDVRDSSLIEQEADIVLYVWRDLDVECRSIMKIAKNRPTGTINKKIRLIYKGGRLYEEADQTEDTGAYPGDRYGMGKGTKKGIPKGGVYV